MFSVHLALVLSLLSLLSRLRALLLLVSAAATGARIQPGAQHGVAPLALALVLIIAFILAIGPFAPTTITGLGTNIVVMTHGAYV